MDTERPHTRLDDAQLAPLGSLDDPTRRRLYEYVAASGAPVSRDQAAAALGLDRSLVVYHLDKLVDEGLLAGFCARPDGRGGPGAGHPAKHFQRADREFAISLPPRDCRLLAELLARADERETCDPARRALDQAAAEYGREVAAADHGEGTGGTDGLVRRLADEGLTPAARTRVRALPGEPYEDDDGVMRPPQLPLPPARSRTHGRDMRNE